MARVVIIGAGFAGHTAALYLGSKIGAQHQVTVVNRRERMTEMFAACVASMGDSLWDGEAATIFMYPVVPDYRRFPDSNGRDPSVTHMELGTSGAWMKRMVHETFMHKFRARPGWTIIPE